MLKRLAVALLIFAGSLVLAIAADTKNESLVVVDSLTPQQIIPGDVSQMYEGTYFFEPSNSLALTAAGLWGYDEGVSTQLADGRILWLTGDAVGAYFDPVQS